MQTMHRNSVVGLITTIAYALTLVLALQILSGCSVLRKPCDDPNDCSEPCKEAKAGCETVDKECKECLVRTDPLSCITVEGQLTAAARSIEKSLYTLAAAEEACDPPIIKTGPLITPQGGMGCTVDIDWTGPIAPLLEKIAAMTNYRLKILGTEPAIPVLVSITAKQTMIADVVQNASYQAVKRAHVLVFPENRVIELRYVS